MILDYHGKECNKDFASYFINEEIVGCENETFLGFYRNCSFKGTFRGCNFEDAYFKDCYFSEMEPINCVPPLLLIPEGDLIGYKLIYKSVNGEDPRPVIARLLIPKEAKRTCSVEGGKYRAEFVKVIDGEGFTSPSMGVHCQYEEGYIVKPDSYDPNPWKQCTHGIHFYLTRQQAEDLL